MQDFQFFQSKNLQISFYHKGNIVMLQYWSCSKIADWIRGYPKPDFCTDKGWREWEKEAKAKHPWRYWLADVGLDFLQDFMTWPARKIDDLRSYIKNRWITHSHALTAHPRDIRPGSWCDVGSRFIFCLFNELVDFVEIELAMWHIALADKEEKKKYHTPFWTRLFRTRRYPQAGLNNLNWQSSLKYDDDWISKEDPKWGQPTPQAEHAKEILALYKWWVEERPKRLDPMEVSGWSEICNRRQETHKNDIFIFADQEDDNQESKDALDRCNMIEDAYEKEDEAMMIRLIKIRHGLWT
jgi:hypothetical protein